MNPAVCRVIWSPFELQLSFILHVCVRKFPHISGSNHGQRKGSIMSGAFIFLNCKCMSLDESIHRVKVRIIHGTCFSRLNENVLYPSSQVVHCVICQRNANIGSRCTCVFSSAVIRNDPILKDPRR